MHGTTRQPQPLTPQEYVTRVLLGGGVVTIMFCCSMEAVMHCELSELARLVTFAVSTGISWGFVEHNEQEKGSGIVALFEGKEPEDDEWARRDGNKSNAVSINVKEVTKEATEDGKKAGVLHNFNRGKAVNAAPRSRSKSPKNGEEKSSRSKSPKRGT